MKSILTLVIAVTLLSGCTVNVLPQLDRGTSENVQRLERTLLFNADHAHANFLRGRAALSSGNPEQALEYFEKARAANPKFLEAWDGIGIAYLDMKKYGKAKASYEAMAAEFPEAAASHEGLAATALNVGQMTAAEQHARRALELNANSAQAHRLLAEALYAQEELAEALSEWGRAMELNPELRAELRPIADDLEEYLQRAP